MAARITSNLVVHLYNKTGFNESNKLLGNANAFFNINWTRNIAKHWNPKFKRERASKVIKIELPDYDKLRKEKQMTPEEIRSLMKEKGLAPPRPWTERPIIISSTSGVFEAYVPPEGDGKMSTLSMPGTKQKLEWLQKKGKSVFELRKIRKYDEDFDVHDFAMHAQEIYIDVHKYLAERNEDKLHELVTEKCYPEMMENIARKTMRWKFLESLSIPRVVHVRCTDIITKENLFAQVTVRFHSRQTLAIYDRFGRLMHGSETMPKDVLEYVVFEKHLPNEYGTWRVHGKIIPDWLPPREPLFRTYRKPIVEEPPLEETSQSTSEEANTEPEHETSPKTQVAPV